MDNFCFVENHKTKESNLVIEDLYMIYAIHWTLAYLLQPPTKHIRMLLLYLYIDLFFLWTLFKLFLLPEIIVQLVGRQFSMGVSYFNTA